MILCCGEALIDMLPDVNINGQKVLRPVTGGSVFNTAIALGRLDQKTGFLSGISNDGFGTMLIADLEQSHVDHALSIRSSRPTTLAVVELYKGNATYTFYDEGSAGRMIESDDFPAIPQKVSTLLFGGISLIAEPCGSAYEALLFRYAKDKIIYIDPNIRPGFIEDETKHRAKITRMIDNSDIVKVSDEDLDWIEPNLERGEAIQKWLTGNPSIVLLSCGAQGSLAYCQSGCVKVDAVKIDVADTVGAGDTFSAGFLASLENQELLHKNKLHAINCESLKSALEFANKTAAITASREGANPPWLHELA